MSSPKNVLETLASGPLQFTYVLSPSVSIVTNVFGDGRNMATVSIVNGTVTVWSASMTQAVPVAETTFDLDLGSLSIKAGAKFTLTIPTQQQLGSVLMQAELQSPPNPWFKFTAVVAQWPLSSATS